MNDSPDEDRLEVSSVLVGVQEQAEMYDDRYLIATLLVYVAKSDGEISEQESNRMIDLLSIQMKIPGSEALERLRTAIMALADDKQIVSRLQQIALAITDEQKFEILWMMMDVMAADQNQKRSELDAITFAGQILGLSLDTIHAQLRSISRKD